MVAAAVLGLAGLVSAQLGWSGALPTAAPAAPPRDPDPAVVAPVGPSAGPLVGPVGAAEEDLRQAPTVTLRFGVGAVLDDEARAALAPVVEVLAAPDAAPVLLTGTAEPGPDGADSRRLAQLRAEAVAAELVASGVPAQLLRTTTVVDAAVGRSVVVTSDGP